MSRNPGCRRCDARRAGLPMAGVPAAV